MSYFKLNRDINTQLDSHHLSHELRISLTGILGANYLLEQTGLSEQQLSLIKLINLSAERLVLLADKLAQSLLTFL